MNSEQKKRGIVVAREFLTGGFCVLFLLVFAALSHGICFLVYSFPKRDALTYLHILQYWNSTGSYAQVLEKFPKFGLMLFHFLPLKWADQLGLPLFPLSVCWMIVLSIITVLLFYKIVLLLTADPVKAMWAGVLLSVHPMLLIHAGCLLRDTPYMMSCLLNILCLIYAIRDRRWYYFLLSGVTLAMCILARFEAWEMLFLFPLFAIFYMVKKGFGKQEAFLFVLLASAGFFVTVALMLFAVGDLPQLYEKGKIMVLSFFPEWMKL